MKTAVIILAAATLSLIGCAEKPDERITACWSPETKQAINALARDVAIERIEHIIRTSSGLNDEKRKKIAEVTKVTLSDFYAVSIDPKTGHITCGASVNFSFTKPDNAILHGNATTLFELFKSESGAVYSINRAPIIAAISDAE